MAFWVLFMWFVSLLAVCHWQNTSEVTALVAPMVPKLRGGWMSKRRSRVNCMVNSNIGVVSFGGSDPNRPQKVNQDNYFVMEGGAIWGVMDGHGLKGHVLTEYLSKQLPMRVDELLTLHQEGDTSATRDELVSVIDGLEEKIERLAKLKVEAKESWQQKLLTQAFHLVQMDAMNDTVVPAGRSGCTCIVGWLEGSEQSKEHKLHVAHVGDSRAIRLHCKEDGNFTATPLTLETTLQSMPEEEDRINACEGQIVGNNVFYGPQGIAMTRSLGNVVMMRAGIVPTPMVESFTLSKESNSVLVFATDGVWDVLSNEKVAQIVHQSIFAEHKTSQEAAEQLSMEAKKSWIGTLPLLDDVPKVDDITCLVVQC